VATAQLEEVTKEDSPREAAERREKMKPVKAIDLVFRAQPMIATLRQIIAQNCDESKMRVFIDDIDNWLEGARTLVQRKDGTK
jgi:hypothetical protein